MASSMKQKQKEIEQKAKEMAQPVIDEYTAKLKQLDDREKKLDEWDASLKELHESVGEADARIREAEEAAREKAIAEIKESEAEIREEEKKNILESADLKAKDTLYDAEKKAEEIVSGAQEKAERLVSDAEEELKKVREQLAADRQEAADARAEAISEKQKAIEERTKQQAEFLENLSRHNESVEQRFNDQFAALTKMRDDLVQRRIDLEDDQADVEEDRKYIQEQKEKYAKSSQAEVDRLNSQLRIVNGDLESKDTLLQEREQEIISLRKMLGETGGKSLEDTVAQLTRERDEALNAVAEFPSSARIAELEQAEKEYQALKSEMKTLTEQKNELERELSLVHFSQNQLDSLRATAQAYEALNGQLQEKLKFISETYKSSRESKFAGLLEIDREKGAGTVRRGGREPKDLTEIVSYVQAYGANRKENPLYYSDETVRVFVASLAASFDASRLLILQGLSGTGKTSLPRLFAEALGLTCDLVSVQPSWRDNRELLGYDNDFTNRFKETEFTKFLYAASKDQKRITLIILDEMNLARIEYYFADFLSELERRLDEEKDVWTVPLISNYSEALEDEHPAYLAYESGSALLKIGKNVWFVGTANNDDSTSTITDKVYDRAQILDLDKRADNIIVNKPEALLTLSLPTLELLFAAARNDDSKQLAQDDWDKIQRLDKENLRKMDITFGSRIRTQLEAFVPVYVACGGTKEKAIDYYLAHKILRKLDEKFDAYIKDELMDLQEKLDKLFGKGVFTESRSKIRVLLRRNFSQYDDGEQ